MDTQALLAKILASRQPGEVFTRHGYKKEYLQYLKQLHPDVCSLPGAAEAATKLNGYRQEMEAQALIPDDAGTMEVLDDHTLRFKGDSTYLQKSLANYQRLMALGDPAANHFKKYLPASMTWEDIALRVHSTERLVPLVDLTLPPEHVSWVLSRLFEWVAWLHQTGFCHGGIVPESVGLVPETHGVVCTSFYHLAPLHGRLNTVSGRYLAWYPPVVFDQKRALPYVDLSLVQRTGLYLLGDPSGNGVRLKKTLPEALIDFLITPHYDAFAAYDEYRHLLRAIFGKPKFHPLIL